MFQGIRGSLVMVLGLIAPVLAHAQIDPIKRRLIEVGYNQALEGHAPLSAYGFFYYNQPQFYATNLTLRLAIAPVYVDSELGISQALSPHTDVGFGLAGGGFADSYNEIRQGFYRPSESFSGDSAEGSVSVYHLFNPNQMIPLNLVFRAGVRQSLYRRDDNTADNFELPEDRTTFHIRTGFRLGGKEPSLTEPLAAEVSVWHEAQICLQDDRYGFNKDRQVNSDAQLVWGRALINYMLNPSEHSFQVGLTGGTSWEADRFSSYRLGGVLPFSSEFPLSIPGYYFQELSVTSFGLLNAQYSLPLDPDKNWRLEVLAATALVDYLPGLEQSGKWHSGVGGGLTYVSPSGAWLATLLYGYGIDAIRSHGRGANQIAILFQYDFEAKGRGKTRYFGPSAPTAPRQVF